MLFTGHSAVRGLSTTGCEISWVPETKTASYVGGTGESFVAAQGGSQGEKGQAGWSARATSCAGGGKFPGFSPEITVMRRQPLIKVQC